MIKIVAGQELANDAVFDRNPATADVDAVVRSIIDEVRQRGDAAVLDYTEKFDGARPVQLEVQPNEIAAARAALSPELIAAMQQAAENIRLYHSQQKRSDYVLMPRPGVMMGQRVIPLQRAGLYVPGGTASYPSSVLMNAIPAVLAGVEELIMVTPPNRDGSIDPALLVAADLVGVQRIFRCGGAQAVAALAYGTESIPPVDKIVGPGNVYVAEAKRQVFGKVAIDMIAGPSEILVLADESAKPHFLAADLLSQAEHDKLASAVLITTSSSLAQQVAEEIERQLPLLLRQEIARVSIDTRGRIIICESIEKGIEIANRIAPEHLELAVENPFDYLGLVKNAGSIFMGHYCPEAVGDYFAGPNHTLPTSGTARFSSPLSVDDFVKKSSFTYYTEQALGLEAKDIACFAEAEGLTSHARSVTIRADKPGQERK